MNSTDRGYTILSELQQSGNDEEEWVLTKAADLTSYKRELSATSQVRDKESMVKTAIDNTVPFIPCVYRVRKSGQNWRKRRKNIVWMRSGKN